MANSVSKRASARVALINGQPTTTSRNIAETFGKSHVEIVRRIKRMQCSEAFGYAHFCAHPYTNEQNGQIYTEYLITRDGFAFLCMGFTGAKAAVWKERYIATFNKMAEKLAAKQSATPSISLPAQQAITPSMLGRRWLLSLNGGEQQATPVAESAAVVDVRSAAEVQAFINEMLPQSMLPLALEVLAKRVGVMAQRRVLNGAH